MKNNIVIAIDGPAGAGKSTVAKIVADRLGFTYIDTGAMYRAIAWKALQAGIDPDDGAAVTRLACHTDIDLKPSKDGLRVFADGEDISAQIRRPEVSRIVSAVAKIGGVREQLVKLQRKLAQKDSVVMDGRDIASNVLPQAQVKVFLTASVEKRAQRRYKELAGKGFEVVLADLQAEIAARDKADSEREIAPLVRAAEAVLLDTTDLSIEAAVTKVIALAAIHCTEK